MAGERVLVVDDESVVLDACTRALRHLAYDVRAVSSGAEALSLLKSESFDLLLTDLKMPELDGIELLRQVRQLDPHLTTMVLTGHGTIESALASIRQGVSGFVLKPFTLQELGEAVGEALEKRRLLRENIRLQAELEARTLAEEERLRAAREEEARREAEETLRIHESFVAAATHDLRGPLTTILGSVEMLRRALAHVPVPEREDIYRRLEVLHAMSMKMARLLEEMLDVSYLRAGRPILLNCRRADLVALARRVVSEQQQIAEGHHINVETDAEQIVGEWDERRLERVLDNLLSNALKYSPTNGTVTVSLRQETQDDVDWAVVTVVDRGVGIPAEDLPRLFQQFYRASNVEGHIAGMGLGLASAKLIVEQHGGTISAISQETVGSTFTVRLPLFATVIE